MICMVEFELGDRDGALARRRTQIRRPVRIRRRKASLGRQASDSQAGRGVEIASRCTVRLDAGNRHGPARVSLGALIERTTDPWVHGHAARGNIHFNVPLSRSRRWNHDH
jgi:hypothetical protein